LAVLQAKNKMAIERNGMTDLNIKLFFILAKAGLERQVQAPPSSPESSIFTSHE
jgi:hypothetical protein